MLKFLNNLEQGCSAVQDYLTFSYFIEISNFRQGSTLVDRQLLSQSKQFPRRFW